MDLVDFVQQIDGFDSLQAREKIRIFSWFLHVHEAKVTFKNEDIRNCFKLMHLVSPDMSVYLPRMASSRPPDLLRERGGYKLERAIRSALDAKYGVHQSVVHVSKILSDLPAKVPDLSERAFLAEAMNCYRVKAYRACIVMTWNLAFDHLLRWILNDKKRLLDFNSNISRRYPKKPTIVISMQDDFGELKESEVIDICVAASIFSKNIADILREKLKRRNICAHPSQVTITQSQADDVVTDLVNNVVLALG
ncbi:hypothetical protein [Inquilinus sp.]|uniref:hypothetical protein n=1 Tax=Inquilinus sp. TaxID=1932117 RepID=UPI0031D269E8